MGFSLLLVITLMANQLLIPGFEGSTFPTSPNVEEWVSSGNPGNPDVTSTGIHVNSGSAAALIERQGLGGFATLTPDIFKQPQLPTLSVTAGDRLVVSGWYKRVSGTKTLRLTVINSSFDDGFTLDMDGDAGTVLVSDINGLPITTLTGYNFAGFEFVSYNYTLPSSSIGWSFDHRLAWESGGCQWAVDDVSLSTGASEGLVAIELAERVIRETVTYFKTDFPVQIAAVDADRADSISLAVPDATNYFDHERLEGIGGGEGPLVYLEFFEGDFDFTNPYTDIDTGRAVYDIPIVVRLTFINESADGLSDFNKRRRRYSVALTEVIRQSPSLGGADSAILSVVPQRVEFEPIEDTGGNYKMRITCPMIAKCEEA